ncbi:MAG: hypothetical protein ACLUCH_07240 [Lachnospirales bacterium]
MLEKIKEKYMQEKSVSVSIKVREMPFSFTIGKEPTTLEKIAIVSTALDIAIVDDIDIQTIDRNVANKLLQFLIIQSCTDIELPKDENKNDKDNTIEEIFEFLDILGEKGVKDILRLVDNKLEIKNLYKELSYMLDNSIKEYYEIRRFRNSSLSKIMNFLSNIDSKDIEGLKLLEPKLTQMLDKLNIGEPK